MGGCISCFQCARLYHGVVAHFPTLSSIQCGFQKKCTAKLTKKAFKPPQKKPRSPMHRVEMWGQALHGQFPKIGCPSCWTGSKFRGFAQNVLIVWQVALAGFFEKSPQSQKLSEVHRSAIKSWTASLGLKVRGPCLCGAYESM